MAFLKSFVLKSPHIFAQNTGNCTQQLARNLRLTASKSKTGDFGDIHDSQNHVGNDGARFKRTVGALLALWSQKFAENSISEPKDSIEHILAHCLGTRQVSDVYRMREDVLSEEKLQDIQLLCGKRLQRMPVQYVIGEWSFRSLNLKMVPPVFIPRPETEELVSIVSSEITPGNTTHVLDLCCGSGAISLSLLQEWPNVKATAVDQSKAACHLTKANAQKHDLHGRIRVIQSQLSNLRYCGKFDIIVSNPPYVFSEDLAKLQPEIELFEDLGALDGGKDGLDVIKIILKIASECLKENGKLFLEVEPRHPKFLRNCLLVNSLGLDYVQTYRDFSGRERFAKIIKI